MNLHFDLIDTPKQLLELCEKLQHESILALDTEFIRETTFYPELALIQVATHQDAWLIDAPALSANDIQPFLKLLTNENILKFLHSSHGDQEVLYSTYQISISPTLDTYESASLLGMGDSVGLRDLIRSFAGIKIRKHLARTHWLHRPLSEEMKKYAMSDVQYLVEIGKSMLRQLEEKGRKDWAIELSTYFENPKIFDEEPESIARRLAKSASWKKEAYAVLIDLVTWREQTARKRNIPRRRIAQDETLVHLAQSRPQSFEQLSKFRGINPGEIRRSSKELLNLMHQKRSGFPEPPSGKYLKPNPNQMRVVNFLGTYLKSLCQELKIAPRLILTSKDINRIVVEGLEDPEAWIEKGICSRQAAELVGEELKAALQGRRGLIIKNGKLERIKI